MARSDQKEAKLRKQLGFEVRDGRIIAGAANRAASTEEIRMWDYLHEGSPDDDMADDPHADPAAPTGSGDEPPEPQKAINRATGPRLRDEDASDTVPATGNPLAGVDFASSTAGEEAADAGLRASDFDGHKEPISVATVRKIVKDRRG